MRVLLAGRSVQSRAGPSRPTLLRMKTPTVLLEEVNPNGNVQALVEQEDRVAYLYLYSAEETGLPRVRSCWVSAMTITSAPASE